MLRPCIMFIYDTKTVHASRNNPDPARPEASIPANPRPSTPITCHRLFKIYKENQLLFW